VLAHRFSGKLGEVHVGTQSAATPARRDRPHSAMPTLPIYWEEWVIADIDAIGAAVNKSAQMKRIHPLIPIVAFVMLLLAGLFWKTFSAAECVDQGGTVVGPMTRS
jgi:hypothetical protein